MWCEQQLCQSLSTSDVCTVLCQAHLYQARQLEEACLHFIQAQKAVVVVTQAFRRLAKEWPEVMLKVNMFFAGVSAHETAAAAALDAQSEGLPQGKRQRTE